MTTVIVSHRVPGFHFWPSAPDEVSYLNNLHRHLFLILVAWKVTHNDRQVEFHTAQSWIRTLYSEPQNFGPKSCEMIAQDLNNELKSAGHPPPAWIEVWEDGESGARVEFQ
jgi:hypothetical protein